MKLTLADILARAARWSPDKTAFSIHGEGAITYQELFDRATRVALRLAGHPGKHVGILLPNSIDWVVCLFGAALAGKAAVLLNTRLTTPELVYQIDQSDTSVLMTGPLYQRDSAVLTAALRDGCPKCDAIVWWGRERPDGSVAAHAWLSATQADATRLGPIDESSLAVLIYTSGTTSLPKGVMLSHAAITTNALLVGQAFGATEDDRVFSAGPFAHSGGLTMHVVLSVLYGATAYSVSYFNPAEVLDTIESNQCTIYNGIETLFLRLLDAPDFDRKRVRSVRTGWATGSRSVLHRIADEVGMPGIIGVYGISEAAPNVLISHHLETPEHRLDTAGTPHPWMRARVCDPETGKPVKDGDIGELVLCGYSLMLGYYKNAEETAKALRDGWLYTGDLVRRRPDGYFEFAGRSKDIIRVGGENVSALEVEDLLHQVRGVAIAAVIPVEDDVYGEVPLAVIKPVNGVELKADDILRSLSGRLASYKLPRRIVFREDMPLTDSGKVQKKQLRALVAGKPADGGAESS
ncbi:class I adenylate-forming enzyme family protein [Castellaniella caeni]|uniref:class I adenylate-forming enzyme family protein n=1 Tax=Castellaniella caeni TaxID=266123 RepID=UPI00082F588D|nr:class I adenylate-forming enzyme family protein [Castellaniella caeni]